MSVTPEGSYLTIARDGDAEIEVRRSRFRCLLRRVEDEDGARAVVEQARRDHRDARHHCSAFVLGPGGAVERSSDDGEPSGTAGAPMLEVLRGQEVSDVAAVVVRWFGGTLLGPGGLVRAYSDAVRAALDEVGVLRRHRVLLLDTDVGHADAGRVENDLRARGVTVRDTRYGAQVTMRLAVHPERADEVVGALAELTAGAASVREVGADWVDGA